MTADATIDYDTLQQEALRGVVRGVLGQVVKSGLPGDHHLYISFDVRAPGVVLSKRLREKYPSEMTIVLQYRFWDLAVTDERFEVKLTFDGIPERLVVPFAAIKVFIDPSVRYVLHFEEPQAAGSDDGSGATDGEGADGKSGGSRSAQSKRPRAPRAPRPGLRAERSNGDQPLLGSVPAVPPSSIGSASKSGAVAGLPGASKPQVPTSRPSADVAAPAGNSDEQTTPPGNSGAQVVSLDAFRKK